MNRKYEIGFVMNPETSEEDVKKVTDNVVGIIQGAGGNIENIDEWGRRPMAFAVEKHTEGIYTFIHADSPGTVLSDIERRLKLNEKVMRFLVLRLDDKLKKANKLTKKWKRIEKMTKRPSSSDSSREDSGGKSTASSKEVKTDGE